MCREEITSVTDERKSLQGLDIDQTKRLIGVIKSTGLGKLRQTGISIEQSITPL